MNLYQVEYDILSSLYGQCEPTVATADEVQKAMDTLERTSCFEPDNERFQALNVIKSVQDQVDPGKYGWYLEQIGEKGERVVESLVKEYPVFLWSERSFQRILDDVKASKPVPGQVMIWYVYNMGYVVKTSTGCFSIDLHHRRGDELVPYLDFACVTHDHGDHYTKRFLDNMDKAGKPVLSNFYPNEEFVKQGGTSGLFKGAQRTVQIGDITVHTYQTDHNTELKNFIMPFEFVCGKEKNACVIYSSGDCSEASQLKKTSDKIDYYIVHPICHMRIAEAAAFLQPKLTLVSHLAEFGHLVTLWRWTWRQGYDSAKNVWNIGLPAVVPVWGEKFVYQA